MAEADLNFKHLRRHSNDGIIVVDINSVLLKLVGYVNFVLYHCRLPVLPYLASTSMTGPSPGLLRLTSFPFGRVTSMRDFPEGPTVAST